MPIEELSERLDWRLFPPSGNMGSEHLDTPSHLEIAKFINEFEELGLTEIIGSDQRWQIVAIDRDTRSIVGAVRVVFFIFEH